MIMTHNHEYDWQEKEKIWRQTVGFSIHNNKQNNIAMKGDHIMINFHCTLGIVLKSQIIYQDVMHFKHKTLKNRFLIRQAFEKYFEQMKFWNAFFRKSTCKGLFSGKYLVELSTKIVLIEHIV